MRKNTSAEKVILTFLPDRVHQVSNCVMWDGFVSVESKIKQEALSPNIPRHKLGFKFFVHT